MKITLLGHASVLVEMDGAWCLMDPVFADPFEEGAVVSCPRRVVHADRLPKLDVLILSHSHLDHFDIPSLARIPRDVHVICPKDHTITYALQQLGFTKVHPTAPMTRIQFGTYELFTTLSSVTNVIEFGVLFKDRTGSFWNQVDSVLSDATIDETLKLVPKVDLLFAMHASQNFGFFASRGAGFPHEMHQMNLSRVLRIKPRMAVPGAAGFRFAGPFAWCNAFLFPMSREQFVADLLKLDASIATELANPGDVFEIQSGQVRYEPKSSKLAETLEDDTRLLRFDPTSPIPPLTDPNPDGYDAERIETAVDTVMRDLFAFISANYDGPDEVVGEYKRHGATYGIGVVFPTGDERRYRVTFGDSAPSFDRDDAVAPDVFHRIAASVLTAWAAHEKSYFFRRAFSRQFSTLYALGAGEKGPTVEPKNVRDLLEYYLLRKAKGAELAVKEWLDVQLRPYLAKEAR